MRAKMLFFSPLNKLVNMSKRTIALLNVIIDRSIALLSSLSILLLKIFLCSPACFIHHQPQPCQLRGQTLIYFQIVYYFDTHKVSFDFFIMPGQRHGFGEHTEYFFWLKANYFAKHLIGDYSIDTDIFEMRREHKMTPSKKRSQ